MSHEINQGGEHFRLHDVNADAPLELVELVYNVTPPATVPMYRCRRGYLHLKAKLKHSMLSILIIFYFELSPFGTFKFHRVTLIIEIVIYVN
jgi:hypothetical protein